MPVILSKFAIFYTSLLIININLSKINQLSYYWDVASFFTISRAIWKEAINAPSWIFSLSPPSNRCSISASLTIRWIRILCGKSNLCTNKCVSVMMSCRERPFKVFSSRIFLYAKEKDSFSIQFTILVISDFNGWPTQV